jgi:hypothetical protein
MKIIFSYKIKKEQENKKRVVSVSGGSCAHVFFEVGKHL